MPTAIDFLRNLFRPASAVAPTIGAPVPLANVGTSDPPWLTRARRYVGLREIVGRQNNPTIIRWWVAIHAPFSNDETPWCAGFVGGVLEEINIKSSRSAAARSYLKWGAPVAKESPPLGAIVVFERGPVNGHVGFLVGTDKAGNLMILGGNQGNAVSIKPFPKSRVLGCRWPAGVSVVYAKLPILTSDGKLSSNEA